MAIFTEVISTSATLALLGLALRWLHGRIVEMEKRHDESLYKPDHQPIYATREDCLRVQGCFLGKIEEIKTLIIDMDRKREAAKDDFRESQNHIENRLVAIETQLRSYNGRNGKPQKG